MPSSLLDKGVRLSKQAAAADTAGEYATAQRLYVQTLDCLLVALKHERDVVVRAKIETRAREYMARAEALKAALERRAMPHEPQSAPAATTTPTAASSTAIAESAARTIVRESPNVAWDSVVGLDDAKHALEESVLLPARQPQLFEGVRKPWRAILLYGPPGTGKSYLARALATAAASTFFSVSASDLTSKWFGGSEQLVRELFEAARAARPAIVFIDEVDSIGGERSDTEHDSSRRLKNELLTQLEGGVGHDNAGVLVLAATNRPDDLDAALRRRFEKRLYISLPNERGRARIIELALEGARHTLAADDFAAIAAHTEDYSAADMTTLAREAVMQPVRTMLRARAFIVDDGGYFAPALEHEDNLGHAVSGVHNWRDVPEGKLRERPITREDFDAALRTVRPSVGAKDRARYDAFTRAYGIESSDASS
jgi:vacuolar protein-sorting-associated protein 4